jgi:hypothetical protein
VLLIGVTVANRRARKRLGTTRPDLTKVVTSKSFQPASGGSGCLSADAPGETVAGRYDPAHPEVVVLGRRRVPQRRHSHGWHVHRDRAALTAWLFRKYPRDCRRTYLTNLSRSVDT